MSQHSSSLVTVVAVLALGATSSTAFAQGYGYGSAGGAATVLGFTASPPIAQNSNLRAVATPADEPVTTGSINRRDRDRTRLHHH